MNSSGLISQRFRACSGAKIQREKEKGKAKAKAKGKERDRKGPK